MREGRVEEVVLHRVEPRGHAEPEGLPGVEQDLPEEEDGTAVRT